MSITSITDKRDGHYDEHGVWQRDKFCFVDCGENCTCREPTFGSVQVQACRPEDRAMLATPAGQELLRCAIEHLRALPPNAQVKGRPGEAGTSP